MSESNTYSLGLTRPITGKEKQRFCNYLSIVKKSRILLLATTLSFIFITYYLW